MNTEVLFTKGDVVIYGSHGKCDILDIEEKNLGGETLKCYRLRKHRDINLPNVIKNQPTFIVPMTLNNMKSLRRPVNETAAAALLDSISKAPFRFVNVEENWLVRKRDFEETIRSEGLEGMARILIQLTDYLSNTLVPPSMITRFCENIRKMFVDEMASALASNSKDVGTRLDKAFSARDIEE